MADRDQDSTPYVDALLAYSELNPGRFQVPGHKGGTGADPAMRELVGEVGLRNDIPSVTEGVDIGPEPTPFQQAQLLAAEAWGAQRTWFLVNGASQGNHATCMALAHGGDRVVVQRNVHSSVIDGLVLSGMRPTFVAPELDPELGIAHGLTPESLAAALDETPDAVAAMVVSPTYFGACADVATLAGVAHGRGVPLVVDEAWGAHLHFHPALPADALASGADLVTSSTHKIVGSLTQAAMLHLGGGARIDAAVVDRCVSLVETTSPSGLLSGSLDAARRQAYVHGGELLGETLRAVAVTREGIEGIPGLAVLDEGMVGRPGIAGWDPLRLSIDVRGTGSTGYRLAKAAFYTSGLDLELYSENVVVAIFGLGEPAVPAGECLVAGLREAVGQLEAEAGAPDEKLAPPPPWGELVMTPREAFLGPQEVIPFAAAAGRVAAEGLAAYPPGIPNVLPGERLTGETLDYIRESIAHGGYVRGGSDRELKTLRVSR
ncbi:MAG TPA: aminotransferase class I/II-fold pyridoxal phosphate-dependent enzyme [Solirubrobacterales bacterium]|jgi:lysine decarboxylase|nr:aminotransferase class I/II-fold pyridoxal phosphate-dependent enzyme [Solirubrobacterales bacterium]